VKQKPGSLTEVLPDLAERWTISNDGTVYTFFLRSGVRWHDGYGEFTAQDVKFSWERLLDPATRANNPSDLRLVESIDVVDPRTVRVTLKQPFPAFLVTIANSAHTAMVNRRALAERGAAHCVRPVGTGPYRVQRAEVRGGVTLVANPEYFGGRPAIDEVELRIVPEESAAVLALRSGETDLMVVREYANIALLRRTPNIIVNADDRFSASTYILALNNSRKPFNDVRVRRALTHALDRRAMMLRVGAGVLTSITHTVIPKSILGHTEDLQRYEYNPGKAKQLLREAGYPDGFKTSVIAPGTAYHPAILTIVQAMWKQIGVDLQLELLDSPALRPRQRAGDYDITSGDPLDAEVGQFLARYDSRFIPLQNQCHYKGQGIDAMIDAQARELNPERRAEIIKQIQRRIAIDAPCIPLFPTVQATAARATVKGLVPNLGWWQLPFYLMDIER
jgi:peptide/nickel transport system substrate-binding protein